MAESSGATDKRQFRSLVAALLKSDWRGMSNPFTSSRNTSGRIPSFAGVLFLNLIWSMFLAFVITLIPDLFAALVIAGFGAAMLLSLQVLLEIDRLIVITDDFQIIGPLPVNSRTYFTSKVAHFLIFVTMLSLSTSVAPAVTAAVTRGNPLMGLIVIVHFWLTALCCTLGAAALYMVTIRAGFGRRIERILGYLQFILIFFAYSGFQIMPNFLKERLQGVDLSQGVAWKILPSYWFACWLKLAKTGWDPIAFILGLFGLALIYLFWKAATSSLSPTSAESQMRGADQTATTPKRQAPQLLRTLWFQITCHEDRALSTLSWAQFKYDTSFRIAVLSVFPMMAFWVFRAISSDKGPIPDPFALKSTANAGDSMFLGFVAVFVPSMVQNTLQYSKSWQASWIYYAAPTDYARLLRATGRHMMVIVAAPIGLIVTGMLTYSFGNFLHALLHALFILALATTNMVILNIIVPRLPFAAARAYGSNVGRMYLSLILGCVVTIVPFSLVSALGYGGYLGWIVIMVITLGIRYGLSRLAETRYAGRAASWEYVG